MHRGLGEAETASAASVELRSVTPRRLLVFSLWLWQFWKTEGAAFFLKLISRSLSQSRAEEKSFNIY